MSKTDELLETKTHGPIAVWTLNRPSRLNAFSLPLLQELGEAIKAIRHQRSIRCLIITGSGDKAFSAGADLKERQDMTLDQTREFVYTIQSTFDGVARLAFPTIAAVNGVAFGGGMELLLSCDLRVFAAHAKVGLTEVAVGIMPGAGGTQRLPRIVGEARAKEMIFSARRLSAAEAEHFGLANRVVPTGQALAGAMEMAKEIAQQAPLAVRQAKLAMQAGRDAGLAAGLDIEAAAYAPLLHTKDRLEGLAAFKEKRRPEYRGE